MSKKELQKWESKFKFWLVMNNLTPKELWTKHTCVNCPLYKKSIWGCTDGNKRYFLWMIREKKDCITIEHLSVVDSRTVLGTCIEWIKHV
jgi:hypothetical protein